MVGDWVFQHWPRPMSLLRCMCISGHVQETGHVRDAQEAGQDSRVEWKGLELREEYHPTTKFTFGLLFFYVTKKKSFFFLFFKARQSSINFDPIGSTKTSIQRRNRSFTKSMLARGRDRYTKKCSFLYHKFLHTTVHVMWRRRRNKRKRRERRAPQKNPSEVLYIHPR